MQLNVQEKKKKQVFFTSDQHFYHKRLLEVYVPDRKKIFKDTEEMNDILTNNWNNVVQKDDIVIFAGDFALASKVHIKEIRDKLNGEILLIKGNHDGNKKKMMECGFKVTSITGKSDYFLLDLNEFIPGINQEILITHFPYHQIKEFIPFEFYGYNISGHIHLLNAIKFDREHKCINVNCELWDYKPISLFTITDIIKQNESQTYV